jgi:hypothetical protein
MKTLTRLYLAVETAAVLILVCGLPAAGLYLLLVWISGPFAVAALPLAVALGLLALAPVAGTMLGSRQAHVDESPWTAYVEGNEGNDGNVWSH